MKTQFSIFCNNAVHKGNQLVVRIFDVSTVSGMDAVGVHPLGKDSAGEIVPVLLIDNRSVEKEISHRLLEDFVRAGKTRITHNFKCSCGSLNVQVHNDSLIKIIQEKMKHGVSKISLSELNAKVSDRQI